MDPYDEDKQFLCGVLERFQNEIINVLNAPDIINGIRGLSESDVAEITAVNDRRRRNKMLLEIVLSGAIDTLISFIEQLRTDIVYGKICDEIQNNRPNLIYRLIQETKPTATAVPRPRVPKTPDNNNQNIPTELEKKVSLDQKTNKYVIKITITEGTPLDDVPNRVIKEWAALLNVNNSWETLADTLLLTRREVRDLEGSPNPAVATLDFMSRQHAWTVQGLLHSLECANLQEIQQTISDTLGREITVSVISQRIADNSNRGVNSRENQEYRNEAAILCPQSKPSNSSESSASSCISTAPLNQVPEQRIQENTVNTSENAASSCVSTAPPFSVPEQRIQETTVNNSESTASTFISTAPTNQVPELRIQETMITESKKCNAETQTASQIQLNDTSDNYEKNCEQEAAAFVRDRENPINLDSYRDIRNSIPSRSVSNQVFGSAALQYETRNDTNIRGNSTNNNNNEHQLNGSSTNHVVHPSDEIDDTHPKDVV